MHLDKTIALTVVTLFAAALAGGCGQSEPEGSPANPPADETVPQISENALENVESVNVVLTGVEVSPTCPEDFNEALTSNGFEAAGQDAADATLTVDFAEYATVDGENAEEVGTEAGVTYTAELTGSGGESLFQWSGGEQSYDNEEACEDVAEEIFASLVDAQ